MKIIPISDLKNNFDEIINLAQYHDIYLTKNGYGSLVLVDLEKYSSLENKHPFIEEFSEKPKEVCKELPSGLGREVVFEYPKIDKNLKSVLFNDIFSTDTQGNYTNFKCLNTYLLKDRLTFNNDEISEIDELKNRIFNELSNYTTKSIEGLKIISNILNISLQECICCTRMIEENLFYVKLYSKSIILCAGIEIKYLIVNVPIEFESILKLYKNGITGQIHNEMELTEYFDEINKKEAEEEKNLNELFDEVIKKLENNADYDNN